MPNEVSLSMSAIRFDIAIYGDNLQKYFLHDRGKLYYSYYSMVDELSWWIPTVAGSVTAHNSIIRLTCYYKVSKIRGCPAQYPLMQ